MSRHQMRVEPAEAAAQQGVSKTVVESRRAEEYFDDGLTCYRKKDYHGALEAWEKAVKLAPDERRFQVNLEKLRKMMDEERTP
ncbi:MAG: tetratricopeptide repeat protein [Myxococcota bacterium]